MIDRPTIRSNCIIYYSWFSLVEVENDPKRRRLYFTLKYLSKLLEYFKWDSFTF